MAQHAGASIPRACGSWADVIAAYRLLSNPSVDPHAIQQSHRELTRKACAAEPVVLAVSDITDLDFTDRKNVRGLGKLGDGRGRGLQQHTTLAVTTDGSVMGVLAQHWYCRPEAPEAETRRERQSRWCEPQVWDEAVRLIGRLECRVVHVSDRGSDTFSFMRTCIDTGVGFLIRSSHDRRLEGTDERLWEHAASGIVRATADVEVSTQRGGAGKGRVARSARVTIRSTTALLRPPMNDPRSEHAEPVPVHVVHAIETRPPAGVDAVEWLLLTDEPVESRMDAIRVLEWYTRRWVIEEFHRAEKEGCRLQSSQLDDAEDIKRLASITGVVAVRLLQLRDTASRDTQADDPGVLAVTVDARWIRMVSLLSKTSPSSLTPRAFWHTIARRGGWLGRKNDPRPGWKAIWNGWQDIALLVQGAILAQGCV